MAAPYFYPDVSPEPESPPVWLWYRVYAAVMALMYFLLAVGCGLLIWSAPAVGEVVIMMALCALSLVLAALFVAAFLVPKKPWAYWYHAGLMALGLTSACCMLACGPLLYYWVFRPEAKAYFGVR